MSTLPFQLMYGAAKALARDKNDLGKLFGTKDVVIVEGAVKPGTKLTETDNILSTSKLRFLDATAMAGKVTSISNAKPLAASFLGFMDSGSILQAEAAPPHTARIALFPEEDAVGARMILPLTDETGAPLLDDAKKYVIGLHLSGSPAAADGSTHYRRTAPAAANLLRRPGGGDRAGEGPCRGTSTRGTGRVSQTGGRSGCTGPAFMNQRSYRRSQIHAAGGAAHALTLPVPST